MMEIVTDDAVQTFVPSGEAGVEQTAVVDQIEQLIDSESVPESVPEESDAQDVSAPPTYDEAFPPLGGGAVGGMAGIPTPGASYAKPPQRARTGPVVKTSTITVLFHIAAVELQPCDHSNIVKMVGAQTQTQIEITKGRDGSITVMVTGKAQNANEAKLRLQKDLQTSAKATIDIPKEHHKNIIGKQRKIVDQIQRETGTIIQLPSQDSQSDTIKIEGTKEGIEKAMHKMKVISDDQYNRHRENVVIPRKFYPWIRGGRSNKNLEKLEEETGCRINVPPSKSDSEEIIIMGEKDKVTMTIKKLETMCSEMEETFSNIQVEIRQSQHKYIERGSGLQDIFDRTRVWVEIPTDGSQTLKLYGPEDKLSSALSLLFEKANSIKTADVECPSWLLKYVIGKNGEKIRSLSAQFPKTTINCQSEKNLITVDAPVEEFDQAREEIERLVTELKNTRDMTVIQINNSIHKHLIGKAGSNINKIKNDTGVNIRIPQDNSCDIEIIGPPDGVKKAKEMLLEQAKKIENEANVELSIDQKWHRMLIGQKGENIQKIRTKYPEVQVSFPNAGAKLPESNKVALRGPRKDVEAASKLLTSQLNVIVDENFSMKVPILKHHHRYIIGKGGINIRKVKDETNTRIDLPSEDADSDLIIITGKKADVDLARKKLLAIQAELEGIYEEEVKIDPKLHNTLIGTKGRIIRSLIEESGAVQIRFPSADNPSEKVSIRGEKADVLKAKEKLLSMAHEKELESYCVEIVAKSNYHRFLIGKKGSNVQKLKKEFGVNYVFPRPDDQDQDMIMIMGRKDAVDKAAADLKKSIQELENTAEDELVIDPAYFKKLTNRSTIDQMTNELGGIKIVPRPSQNIVKMSGPKTCVEEAKLKLEAMLEDLKAQIELEVEIPRQYHRDIIGPGGHNVRSVTSNFSVQISFPTRKPEQENGHAEDLVNGDTEQSTEPIPPTVDPQDIIKINGRPENCEQAKAALVALIPVTETVEIPYEYHRMIIGRGGENIKKMMDSHDVNVQVPGTTQKSDNIIIRGHKDKVAECRADLLEQLKEWDNQKEDRILKSYQLNLTVDHRHHSKIIGRKGAVINKIKDNHDVQIKMPDRNSTGDLDVITLTGYEQSCEAARDEIMKIVSELEERISDTVEIDSRVHARFIGQRGKNIRKIMEKFAVDIKFTGGDTGNTVTIEGNDNNVEECKDHLIELAEEYMDAVLDRLEVQAEMSQYSRPSAPQAGFFVRDAPWQQGATKPAPPPPQVAPDTSDMAAFPGLGAASVPRAQSSMWTGNKTWR